MWQGGGCDDANVPSCDHRDCHLTPTLAPAPARNEKTDQSARHGQLPCNSPTAMDLIQITSNSSFTKPILRVPLLEPCKEVLETQPAYGLSHRRATSTSLRTLGILHEAYTIVKAVPDFAGAARSGSFEVRPQDGSLLCKSLESLICEHSVASHGRLCSNGQAEYNGDGNGIAA